LKKSVKKLTKLLKIAQEEVEDLSKLKLKMGLEFENMVRDVEQKN